MEKHTPYDTGKVKIGLLYTPPPPIVTPEDTWAQSVLLGDRHDFTDLALSTIQSLLAIVILVLVVTLLGGFFNA
jgi:hypothetical protein